MNKIRFIIADDQALILDGIKVILEAEEDFEVVAVAGNGAEAFEKVLLFHPDIVLLDIRMPIMDGVECTKRIKNKFPEVVVLLLTTFDEQEYIIDAFKYGANGYLLKDITRDQLIRTIRDALKGETILSSKIAMKLVKVVSDQNNITAIQNKKSNLFEFTDREAKIASLLAKGFTNKQISTTLSFSEGTVKNTVSAIYSKINIFDRASAAIFLKEQGY